MTRGQQIILAVVILMLFGVTALLVVTLINSDGATPPTPVPILTLPATATAARLPDTPTPFTVPPTWTPQPSRTAPSTNTPGPTRTATPLPTITPTFAPTFTPRPTVTPTVQPTETLTTELENPGFEGITPDTIPGWNWWAADNFEPGGEYNPDSSFETPLFKLADDPVRIINGPTLQVDAEQHLKFRVYIFQTVPVSPTTTVGFEVKTGAFSGTGVVRIAAGIDPNGGEDCSAAQWGEIASLNQDHGTQTVAAPQVVAGDAGAVTVCLYAEPLYAAVSNAAFFDDAELILNPQEETP